MIKIICYILALFLITYVEPITMTLVRLIGKG